LNIVGIEKLYYGVEDMDASIRFHQDLGMEKEESGRHGADFRLRNDTHVHLRAANDASLPPATIRWLPHLTGSTVREVIWGVDNAATLEAVATEISRDREVTRDAAGVLHTVDDCGFHIGFMVTKRKDVAVEFPPVNTVGRNLRRNRQAEGTQRRRVGPYRAGHVVYWVPGDLVKLANFYIGRLKFRLTDEGPAMRFMRCAGSSDHHSLLFQREGDFNGFQHVAYEYRDFDEVMMAGSHLVAQGWKSNTGPLRHNVSSTCSWYVWNPAGGAAEVYSDMDCVDDDWVPHYHDPKDPSFYGVSWSVVRPGQRRARPGEWLED
jgi:hypothetical protein